MEKTEENWEVEEVGPGELFIVQMNPDSDGFDFIAEMSNDYDMVRARLIAAAPKLLKFCKRYVQKQEEINAEMNRKPSGSMYFMAKKTLLKAEPESEVTNEEKANQ